MAEEKRYWWLKLPGDFFNQIEIKLLRKIAGGDTYTIIYQKMLLLSLKNGGLLFFEGFGESFAEEIALTIDEDIENVKVSLSFLQSKKLIIEIDKMTFEMQKAKIMTGSETSSAERKRRQREREKENKNGKLSHDSVTMSQVSHVEKKREDKRREDINIESYTEKEKTTSLDNDILFQDYINLFINFAKKNINKRSLAQQTFIQLSEMEKRQIITGAKNYINFYKADRKDDTIGQYSINAFEFLENAVFKEYQTPINTDKNPYKYNTDVNDPKGWGKKEIDKNLNTDPNDMGGWA